MERLIFAAILAVISLIAQAIDGPRRIRDRSRTLKWLASRIGGTHLPASRDRHPAIVWDIEKTSAILFIPENSNGRAQGVTFRLRLPCRFRLRLLPETGWARLRRFFGAQDLQIRDDPFDDLFLIQSDDPSGALRLLTREVRAALAGLTRVTPLTLETGTNGIQLRALANLDDDLERLSAFAEGAVNLGRTLAQLLDPAMITQGVEEAIGSCPVCSTPVEDDRGICTRCRTPHHKDCWNYLGGCAMYGCAGRPPRLRSLPARGRRMPATARR
jgi:hypothetical protein